MKREKDVLIYARLTKHDFSSETTEASGDHVIKKKNYHSRSFAS